MSVFDRFPIRTKVPSAFGLGVQAETLRRQVGNFLAEIRAA